MDSSPLNGNSPPLPSTYLGDTAAHTNAPSIWLGILQLLYHEFNKEEQLRALEEEKMILEGRKKLKESGVVSSTMVAIDGAASAVGSGIVGGVGLVGTGVGAGVGFVGTGLGAVGSGLSKAGKFMGRTITGHSSNHRKSGSSTPVNNALENGGGAKPR